MRANYEGLVVPLGVYALWLALVLWMFNRFT